MNSLRYPLNIMVVCKHGYKQVKKLKLSKNLTVSFHITLNITELKKKLLTFKVFKIFSINLTNAIKNDH